MSWPGVILIALVLTLAIAARLKRGPKKQCPKCGAYVALDARSCKYCDFEFAA